VCRGRGVLEAVHEVGPESPQKLADLLQDYEKDSPFPSGGMHHRVVVEIPGGQLHRQLSPDGGQELCRPWVQARVDPFP
jgi:hypothetical protein